jgi:nanoRNase/pAp phosphatase (c-di-AMP/oligoRNAs hydrolase)
MDRPFDILVGLLDPTRPVLVQAHDFPDHDAVGSAYALQMLLRKKRFSCDITHGGLVQSISLTAMITELSIEIKDFDKASKDLSYQTIIVDGSPAGGTVKTVAGQLVGVIDHHSPARKKIKSPFVDLRVETGSCSAIIWTYWEEAGETPDRTTATALLAGIQLDTDFLSRRVSKLDLEAHYHLFFLGDCDLAREIVRISLSVAQLEEIGHAFSSFKIKDSVILAEMRGNYSSELLSVLADFLLRLREITTVLVIEIGGRDYRLSARTRDTGIDIGCVIRDMLSGLGSGGGHPHMAGGFIHSNLYPGGEMFLKMTADGIAEYRSKNETDCQAD